MKKHSLLALALVSLLGILPRTTPLAGAQEAAAAHNTVVGTWFVQVPGATGLVICSNGVPIAPAPPPFVQLETFAKGGTYTETNSVLNFNTASSLGFNGSDGHGAWKGQGDGHYKLAFRKLLYTATGEYAGNADLNENIAVQQDAMSGTFTVKFSLLDGTQLCAGGQFSGFRITVEK